MNTQTRTSGCGAIGALLIQIVPTGYVAITGHAPTWIRIWLASFPTLWLLYTVATAAKAAR